jgi:CubicO group peptidase (beta-lactamase class C family)
VALYIIMTLSDTVQSIVDAATANPDSGIPGLAFTAVNKNGTILSANASGNRGKDSQEAMTVDTVLWIASCTKLMTAVAALQLVEQGRLHLDDTEEARNTSSVYKSPTY